MAAHAHAAPPHIVAAESAYADIARQVAGPGAVVTAVLVNPATDPHLFEPTPSTARAVAGASLIIQNGIGYDPWMARLIAASSIPPARVIDIAGLLGRQPGNNPHLWYDPATMPALARALADRLGAADPADAPGLAARRDRVLGELSALQRRIDDLRRRFSGRAVAATEPVFGLMAAALGLADRHAHFETAVMNGTEPAAGDVAAMQDDLRAHRIGALITNRQASDPAVVRLLAIARQSGVPIVQITETLPPGKTYQGWIGDELTALQAALAAPS